MIASKMIFLALKKKYNWIDNVKPELNGPSLFDFFIIASKHRFKKRYTVDLESAWPWRHPPTVDDVSFGCDEVAEQIQQMIGGDLRWITNPIHPDLTLGPVKVGNQKIGNWFLLICAGV